jgi:hypothetical protein
MTTFERAEEARRLMADEGLMSVFQDIRADAAGVFLSPAATPEQIAAAHEKVRAVEFIQNALTARITDETFEQRKGNQDRG